MWQCRCCTRSAFLPNSLSTEGEKMLKAAGMFLILVGVAGFAAADIVAAPEINAGSASSALALLSGAILVIRGRKK
jgi:hypothetical protein